MTQDRRGTAEPDNFKIDIDDCEIDVKTFRKLFGDHIVKPPEPWFKRHGPILLSVIVLVVPLIGFYYMTQDRLSRAEVELKHMKSDAEQAAKTQIEISTNLKNVAKTVDRITNRLERLEQTDRRRRR